MLPSPWARLVSALLSTSLVVGPGPPTPQSDADEEIGREVVASGIEVSARARFEVQSPGKVWQLVGSANEASRKCWLLFCFEDALMPCGLELVLAGCF